MLCNYRVTFSTTSCGNELKSTNKSLCLEETRILCEIIILMVSVTLASYVFKKEYKEKDRHSHYSNRISWHMPYLIETLKLYLYHDIIIGN